MNRMIVTFFILMFTATSAHATAQYPDKILYEGKEYIMHSNPMEPYFEKYPDKRPERDVISTALWRGYVATFAINDGTLVLSDIEIQGEGKKVDGLLYDTWKSVKKNVFPGVDQLTVDWFTGILVLPYGELLRSVDMGYGSTYSRYILLEIKEGKLTGKRTFDNKQYEEFKEKQFQAYKKTEAYRKLIAGVKKKGTSQALIDMVIRDFFVEYTTEFMDEKKEEKTSNK